VPLKLKLAVLSFISCALVMPAWAGNIVINPDFASPYTYPSPDPGNFPGQTAIAGWTESGSVGSNSIGGPFWDNGTVPGGINSAAFMQVTTYGANYATGSLSQVLNLSVGTTYDFSFLENSRAYDANPDVELLLDNTVLYSNSNLAPVDPAGVYVDPFQLVTGTFTATATSQTLEFLNTQNTSFANGPYGSANDESWLVTDVDVSVSAAPEPGTGSTLVLFGILAMVGYSIRSRFRKTAARPSR
jgi:hypothetical protein